jgi:hypothetical protein
MRVEAQVKADLDCFAKDCTRLDRLLALAILLGILCSSTCSPETSPLAAYTYSWAKRTYNAGRYRCGARHSSGTAFGLSFLAAGGCLGCFAKFDQQRVFGCTRNQLGR